MKTEVKEIPFNGSTLLGIRDASGQVWLAVRKVCSDIGLSDILGTFLIGSILLLIVIYLITKFCYEYSFSMLIAFLTGLHVLTCFTIAKNGVVILNGQRIVMVVSTLLFPVLSYGEDFINEIWGKKIAKVSLYIQLLTRICISLYSIWIININSTSEEIVNSYQTVMNIVPKSTINTIFAMFISSTIDIHIFSKLKEKNILKLGFRTWLSTLCSLIINNIIFMFMTFLGIMNLNEIIQSISIAIGIRIFACIIEVPFIYCAKEIYLHNKK